MDAPARFERETLHALTFVVALCSFAYELVYAELLTVVYGGTVTQYGLTVGLFFFSLGIGSFLARTLDHERGSNFVRTEVLLAVVAPLGVLFVLWIGSASLPRGVPVWPLEWLARLPVIAVGLLSGFELPLLTAMVERLDDGSRGRLAGVRERLRRWTYAVVGLVFHVNRERNAQDSYSAVLGMDYLGGLAGSLVYVFVLYPEVGLLPTVFVLGLLNAVAALAFVLRFGDVTWDRSDDRRVGRTAMIAACLLLAGVYGGVAVAHQSVDEELTGLYLERTIESEYPSGDMTASVTDVESTAYQKVTFYDREWAGQRDNPYFEGERERCFRLGSAVQLCDSWAEPYHQGLVDVPMSRFANGTDTEVLVVGGGDWIAVDHLRAYGVSVDMVDLDGQFLNMSRDDPWLERYHDDAYEYDNLNVTVADAHQYLESTDERYDLILLDLPGATDDDLLGLYSTQFYRRIAGHLKPDGVAVSWTYDRATYAQHRAAYANTVRAAGFERMAEYAAWADTDEDGGTERVEQYVMLSPEADPAPALPDPTAYVARHDRHYADVDWQPIPRYPGVEPNGLFDPNYDILIDT